MVEVSFKIDKIGKRYVPRAKPLHHGYGSRVAAKPGEEADAGMLDSPIQRSQEEFRVEVTNDMGAGKDKKDSKLSFEKKNNETDHEASFALNLFQGGFSLSKPSEKGTIPAAYEVMDLLYPYDRTSESFLAAINQNQLPGDILSDIPCKYIDGCVVCEVRDYRHTVPHIVNDKMATCHDWSPAVHKVTLRPTTESIVKDIAVMAKENWTYQDMLEIESRILKLVQPLLSLEMSTDISKQAYISNYNSLKFNHGGLAAQRYRTKIAGVDRKIHLAAARALLKANLLAKRRQNIPDVLADRCQDFAVAEKKLDSFKEDSQGKQDAATHRLDSSVLEDSSHLQTAKGTTFQAVKSSLGLAPPSLGVPSSLNGPSDSVVGTSLSVLGKRDGDDLFAMRASQSRKLRQDQDRLDKFQSQLPSYTVEGKELETERTQSMLQPKAGTHQAFLSLSENKKISEVVTETEVKLPSQAEIPNISSEAQKSCSSCQKPEDQYKQEQVKIEVDQPSQLYQNGVGFQPSLDKELSFGKLQMTPQEWPSVGQPSLQRDSYIDRPEVKGEFYKNDETPQIRKFIPNMVKPKSENTYIQSPTALKSSQGFQTSSPSGIPGTISSNSGDCLQTATVALSSSTGLIAMKETLQTSQAMPLTLTTTGMLEQANHMSQAQAVNTQLSRRRITSLSKTMGGSVAASFPANNSALLPVVGSPSGGSTSGAKVDQGSAGQGHIREPLDILKSIVSCAQRHGKHIKEQKLETVHPVNKNSPSWQLVSLALTETSEDYVEPKGQKSLAKSFAGGSVNARKTRFLQFSRMEPTYSAVPNASAMYHRTRLRLVLYGRPKDAMIEAVIQIGDDQDEEVPNGGPPCIVLSPLANANVADLFAMQFITLLEKDGFELVEDQVQPFASRGNAVMNSNLTPHSLPIGGPQSLGASLPQLGPPKLPVNQNVSPLPETLVSSLNQLQPNPLGGGHMPPQAVPQNRQLPVNYMNQRGTPGTSKPLQQLDPSSPRMGAMQQQQQPQQHQLQRQPQLMTASISAQLTPTSHNQGQLPQMMVHPNHLHYQFLQRQQSLLQRKMLGLGNLGNVNNMSGMGVPVSGVQGSTGNMVGGFSGVSAIGGMAGMSNISSPVGGISNLGNINQLSNISGLGQNTGVPTMINQQIRPGTMGQAQAAAAAAAAAALHSKSRLASNTIRSLGTASLPVRNSLDNMTGMAGANQVHASGLNIMSPSFGRGGLISMQRAAIAGMGPPKMPATSIAGVTGHSYYSNPQQLSPQQLNLQQISSPQLNSQQLTNTQINSPPLSTQSPSTQQLNLQQVGTQPSSTGALSSFVGGPQSPQSGAQTLGSVGSLSSSPMDIQNTNRGGPSAAAAGQGRRTPVPQTPTG